MSERVVYQGLGGASIYRAFRSSRKGRGLHEQLARPGWGPGSAPRRERCSRGSGTHWQVMSGAWLAEEAYAGVDGWGSQGELRPEQGPPRRPVVLNGDESCLNKLGKGELAREDRRDDG